MKHNTTKPNAPRFARDLVKNFGRVKAKEVCHFLIENKHADATTVSLAKQALEHINAEQVTVNE